MKKRIMGLLLSVCMVMPTWVLADKGAEQSSEAYNVLKLMGLAEKDADEPITRAEFAQIIFDAKTFADEKSEESSWGEDFFGDAIEDMDLIEDTKRSYSFDDVDPYDERAAAITALAAAGIMKGIGENNFAPERRVKNLEAVKTLLDSMGYAALCNLRGGYPSGYISMAAELGVSDGVDMSSSAEATAESVAKVVYNSFDVKLMKLGYGDDGKELSESTKDTFLTGVMKVDYVKGVMTDNGITSLYGATEVGKNLIVCGGKTITNNADNAVEIRDYIGYNVKAFYYIDGDREDSVVCVVPARKNEVLTIDADDINYFKNGKLNYSVGNRDKSVNIPSDMKVIYNGAAKKSFSNDDFIFSDGYVTLIAPEGSTYSTAVVTEYKSMLVGFADKEEKIIYNKSYSRDGSFAQSISLKDSYEEGTLGIYDADGNKLDFADIGAGTVVDVCQSELCAKVIVSGEKISDFNIRQMGEDDRGLQTVSDEEKTLYIDDACLKSADSAVMAVNQTLTLYLNSFGKVVFAEKENGYSLKVGYLLRAVPDDENGDENLIWLKLVNTEGSTAKYKTAEKIKFGDSETTDSSKYEKLKGVDFYRRIKQYEGSVIGYKINADGLIDMVEIPLDKKRDGENRLQLIYDSNGEKVMYKPDGFGFFKDYTWTNESTRIFTTPTDGTTDETKYSCTNREFLQSQASYAFKSYGTTKNANLAEYMVIQRDIVKTMNFGQKYHSFFIVSDVCGELSPDEEPAIKLSGYKTNGYKVAASVSEMTLYAKDDAGEDRQGNKVNPALMATDTLSMDVTENPNPKYYQIKAGDIIRYTYDSEEIYPTSIELLYRADMENPYFGAKGQKGGIAGSVGVIDDTLTDSYRYNPFVFSSAEGVLASNVSDAYTGYRVTYGFVYSVDNGISTVTTQDLTAESYDPNFGGGKYFRNYVPMRGSSTKVAVTFNKKNVSAKVGSLADIKPYTEAYGECSKMLTVTDGGYFTTVFVINGEFGK